MKKLLPLILLLIFSCEEVLDPDTTAPTVVVTYPVNNSTLTETTTVTVDVADDGDIGIVKLLVDGVETYADTTAPYQFVWDVCVQTTGTHTLMAKTEDGAGNQGQSDLLTFTIDANYDCEDVCGGDKLLDNCEVCDADTSNDCTTDCNGDWGGSAYTDECDDCVGGTTNLTDCSKDCLGVWGGTAVVDDCGFCTGGTGNITFNSYLGCDSLCRDTKLDCNDDCGGTAWVSDCGCVSADNSGDDCDDCFNVPNGTDWISDCGCVSANNSGDECDDCTDTPNGTALVDDCGECTGSDTNLEFNYLQDCYGVCNGDAIDNDNDGLCDELQGTVTDIDGNIYKTIIIGEQTWMAENLKVAKYNNGDAIPNITDLTDLPGNVSTYYSVYDNIPENADIYGHLYNKETALLSGNICPEGWGMPTKGAWNTLINYLPVVLTEVES